MSSDIEQDLFPSTDPYATIRPLVIVWTYSHLQLKVIMIVLQYMIWQLRNRESKKRIFERVEVKYNEKISKFDSKEEVATST